VRQFAIPSYVKIKTRDNDFPLLHWGNETTNYHPINNGLLTAGEEVSPARFLRTQIDPGNVFNLERIQENVAISKNI